MQRHLDLLHHTLAEAHREEELARALEVVEELMRTIPMVACWLLRGQQCQLLPLLWQGAAVAQRTRELVAVGVAAAPPVIVRVQHHGEPRAHQPLGGPLEAQQARRHRRGEHQLDLVGGP